MEQRILFIIRGKLGDTLVAYSVAREFMLRHPQHEVTLIVRAHYVPLIQPAQGVPYAVIPYRNRMHCALGG